MTTDGGIRASDQDRESTVEVLREAYAAGRLSLDEFDERTTAAYSAKTWGDLRALTADLPAAPVLGADLPAHAPDRPEPAPVADPGPRRPFVPMLPMALVWLAIAAAARAPEAMLPLVILALFAFRAASWRSRPAEPPTRRDDHSGRSGDTA